MPSINETAYPRLKNVINKNELANIYTPTEAEIDFANKSARKDMPKLCLLVMLKTFQRLGYFDYYGLKSPVIALNKSTSIC